ncbi:MAG: cytochrome c [Alphaproteobacteria bacterium]|nr:cytochrome c [Alphaproteobacteria bacterium]
MRKKTLMIALIGALATCGIVGATATIAVAQEDPIKARKDNRKAAGAALRAAKAAIDAKADAKAVTAQAAKLKELELAFVKLFPVTSKTGGETEALPAIWDNPTGFQAAHVAADATYDKLAVAAGGGDFAVMLTAWQAIGKDGCGNCHTTFRVKK